MVMSVASPDTHRLFQTESSSDGVWKYCSKCRLRREQRCLRSPAWTNRLQPRRFGEVNLIVVEAHEMIGAQVFGVGDMEQIGGTPGLGEAVPGADVAGNTQNIAPVRFQVLEITDPDVGLQAVNDAAGVGFAQDGSLPVCKLAEGVEHFAPVPRGREKQVLRLLLKVIRRGVVVGIVVETERDVEGGVRANRHFRSSRTSATVSTFLPGLVRSLRTSRRNPSLPHGFFTDASTSRRHRRANPRGRCGWGQPRSGRGGRTALPMHRIPALFSAMSTTELKSYVDERTPEERQWLAAYLLMDGELPHSSAV